jgi:protein TonB
MKPTALKTIIYILFGILFLIVSIIGYKFIQLSKKNELLNITLQAKIDQISKKYKRDSIEFAKVNSEALSEMKQELKEFTVGNTTNKSKKNSRILGKKNIPKAYQPKPYISQTPKLTNTSKKTLIAPKKNPIKVTQTKPITKKIASKPIEKKVSIPTNSTKRSKIIHGIPALDNAFNINSVDKSPIYPGCETSPSEFEKKNCFASKVASYVLYNFNKNTAKETNKAKIRILFVINKNGHSKLIKSVGYWPSKITNEAKRVIKSLPKMTPGMVNNKTVSVKYSLQIPLTIY